MTADGATAAAGGGDGDAAGAHSAESSMASVDAAADRRVADTTIIRRVTQQHRRHQRQCYAPRYVVNTQLTAALSGRRTGR